MYISYYTNSKKFMGRQKYEKDLYRVIKNWYNSGNYIKLDGKEYTNFKDVSVYLH